MSASAQAQKVRPQTSTWNTMFPPEQVTEQQSALFVKKLLAVAVSNITYLRAIFPEKAFGDRCLEDLNLKILRDDSSCPGSCQVINWIKGCFDAIDKKYLRVLIIGVYTDPADPDTVFESYTFKFTYENKTGLDIYRNNSKIASAHTAVETKNATIRLLRTLVVLTQSLGSLPEDVMMTMKIGYYDELTPAEYEPPGFKSCETAEFQFDEEKQGGKPCNISVGEVDTNWHSMKLRIKTARDQFTETSPVDAPEAKEDAEEPVTELSVNMNGLDEEELRSSQLAGDAAETMTSLSGHDNHQVPGSEPAEGDLPISGTAAEPTDGVDTCGSQASSQPSQEEDLGVICPCGNNEDDGLMIMCAVCKHWQHGICFLVLDENNAPERHICNTCANPSDINFQPTDPGLFGLEDIAVQATCLWRRALNACQETNRILAPNFARRLGVEVTVGIGLINRLEKEGFLRQPQKGKKLGKIVDKAKLKEGIAKYFTPCYPEQEEDEQASPMQVLDDNVQVITVDQDNKLKNDKKNVDMEIEKIVSRADNMNLMGHRNKMEMKESNVQKVGRGKKRVKSNMDEENEFDICSSQQDSAVDVDYNTNKRRKASISRKALQI